jgi:hypothetical protein
VGTHYDKDSYDGEISDAFGGPLDAKALRMMTALARSWDVSKVVFNGGVRALHGIGTPLEKVHEACAGKWYRPAYEAGIYYEDAAAFVDSHLKNTNDPMYYTIIAMAIGVLEKEGQKHARFFPALENFIKEEFDADTDLSWNYKQRHLPLDTARFAFAKGLGKLSPGLQKLELRLMLDIYRAGYQETNEETIEAAKRLNLPPEWFELWFLVKESDDNKNSSLADHFKKLFAEDRPLFDKVHRAFYSTWDGIAVDDPIHPRTRKSQFVNSLKLLAVKLANGAGEGDLADLKKNWAQYMPIEKLTEDGLARLYNDFLPYALLYESGIEPLDALFSDYFKTGRENDKAPCYEIERIFVARQYWVDPIGAIKTFIARYGSVEEILLVQMDRPVSGYDSIPPLVIRETIAAYPEESRAFLAKAVKESKPDELLHFLEAAFARDNQSESEIVSGGFPITEALVLLDSTSKKVLDAAQEIFLNHEAEIRPEIEARLPKFKKAASLAAQQLIAKWNARA